MPIRVECPRCHDSAYFADNDAGLAVACLACGQHLRIPAVQPKPRPTPTPQPVAAAERPLQLPPTPKPAAPPPPPPSVASVTVRPEIAAAAPPRRPTRP